MTSLAAKVAILEGQVAKLQFEIDQITNSPQYKAEVEFRDKLIELLGEYSKTVADVILLLEPQMAAVRARSKGIGRARKKLTFKNPHTLEVVTALGGNQRTLRQWREKWGKSTVASWRVD